MRELILGTRGSALALWQARHVAAELRRAHPGIRIVERIIKTEGDLQQVAPLGRSDVGVFVREIHRNASDVASMEYDRTNSVRRAFTAPILTAGRPSAGAAGREDLNHRTSFRPLPRRAQAGSSKRRSRGRPGDPTVGASRC